MNFYDEPSPFLWWESNLWWVLALAMSAGLGVWYWLLWGPRQPGDVLTVAPAPVIGRLRRVLDAVAWAVMATAFIGPMVFVTAGMVATDSLVPHCVVMEGQPSFSYFIRWPWFGLALVALVGGIAYARRAQSPRDARDVLLARLPPDVCEEV
ncbi:hypothetical protein ACN6A1_02635 [Myxococcus virescens]|uniref:hypothetical protein n=1 Tax=Myxococcus virescens TaxID=83456 RepID=UPI003DA36B4D